MSFQSDQQNAADASIARTGGRMPDAPLWAGRLDQIVSTLEALPFIDRASLQSSLNVSARRAQQILSPCISQHVGKSGIAEPAAVIQRLRSIVKRDGQEIEVSRRRNLAEKLNMNDKPLWVEAPTRIIDQQFEVEGVSVERGRIVVTFDSSTQALQRLLALAMAVRNQPEVFEQMAGKL